jgi:hypothetical protein
MFIIMMITAILLHGAWHMTLLTSKILQQIKEANGIIMTDLEFGRREAHLSRQRLRTRIAAQGPLQLREQIRKTRQ